MPLSGDAYNGWDDQSRLSMGRNSYGSPKVLVYDPSQPGHVEIGSFCSVAAEVTFLVNGEHRHDFVTTSPLPDLKLGTPSGHARGKGPIIVGHDVWIGRNATILSGVTIGTGAVIGAYSVVTRDVRPYAVVGGNPARELRRRFSDAECDLLLQTHWWEWSDERIAGSVSDLWSADIAGFLRKWSRGLGDGGSVPQTPISSTAGATDGKAPLGSGCDGVIRASVVVPAFNLADYLPIALDSALAQDDIGGAVEVIVVDDGSTDGTPSVLASYGDRIRVVTQANGGLVAAVNRGLYEARGEYIALLDADDVWPRDRLARHVATLNARPELGLTYGDMEVIDAAGAQLEPSFYGAQGVVPTEGRILGRLIHENFIGTSSITFRASLLAAVHPIPSEAAYADWAIAVGVASVAQIGLVPGISYSYRQRGDNMVLGGGPERHLKHQRRMLPWYRWMMANVVEDPMVGTVEIARCYAAFQQAVRDVALAEPTGARAILELDREAAARVLESIPPVGPGAPRSRSLMRALSFDPFDGATAVDLVIALAAEAQQPAATVPPILADLHGRERLILVRLQDVVREPDLLHAHATEFSSAQTLVILAPPGADLTELIAITEADPDLRSDSFDAIVIEEPRTLPAWRWLEARAAGWLSTAPTPSTTHVS